ncbi:MULTISPECIES: hypothetical protein [unclassified Nocardia]|uniref:hypothetical protein n=1 Tax=unclassified Nocardia TaxID=2637762 RepID=UPI001CE442A6|nr:MULTISPECIES: hypothetical protein [unclassified Nocardia]
MTVAADPKTAAPEPDSSSLVGRRVALGSRTVSIRVGTVLRGLAITVATAAAVIFAVLWWSARSDLHNRDAAAADRRHAEQVATDYALGASTIDYQNFPAWMTKLKANTTSQLAAKFDATGPALQQLLTPLRWTSTAKPIAAKVLSESGSSYQVDVFLDVDTTSAQTPDGARTTVTYHVTVDRDSGWKLTDVGGMDGALPVR